MTGAVSVQDQPAGPTERFVFETASGQLAAVDPSSADTRVEYSAEALLTLAVSETSRQYVRQALHMLVFDSKTDAWTPRQAVRIAARHGDYSDRLRALLYAYERQRRSIRARIQPDIVRNLILAATRSSPSELLSTLPEAWQAPLRSHLVWRTPFEQVDERARWIARFDNHAGRLLWSNRANDNKKLPARIRVLLPLTGDRAPAGLAIAHGISDAYLETTDLDAHSVQLDFIDTERTEPSILARYVRESGRIPVIGPLFKDRIEESLPRAGRGYHAVVLNSPPSTSLPSGIKTLSLPIEDDIQALATAIGERDGRALLVLARDAWAERVRETAADAIETAGGQLSAVVTVTGADAVQALRPVLHIDRSERRSAELRRLVGRTMVSVSRPRQDIDAILLATGASDAQRILPALAFHSVSDLSIYATSTIYDRRQGPLAFSDQQHVIVADAPIVLLKEYDLNEIAPYAPTLSSDGQMRLYGLGHDAFQVLVESIDSRQDIVLFGLTGALQIERDSHHIKRTPALIDVTRN